MENMDIDVVQASIQSMNECQSGNDFAPRIRAQELALNTVYAAPIIRKIKTKFGDAVVLENDTFTMFLPKKYVKADIIENMPGRMFMITGFTNISGKDSPKIHFSIQL